MLDFEYANIPPTAPEDVSFSPEMIKRLESPDAIVDERDLGEYLGQEFMFAVDLSCNEEFRREVLKHLRTQVVSERQPLFDGLEWGLGLIPEAEGVTSV